MDNFDFRTVPKLICEGTAMGINKHFFSFAIKTGPGINSFAMVPEDAKSFLEGLKKTVELYEVQFGPIPDTNKSIPSPIDMSGGSQSKN